MSVNNIVVVAVIATDCIVRQNPKKYDKEMHGYVNYFTPLTQSHRHIKDSCTYSSKILFTLPSELIPDK